MSKSAKPASVKTTDAANRQLLVLGMHRSGTSAVTGALARMGVHVGDEEQLTPTNWENPLGFFERREARRICDALLHASGADWWKVSAFNADNADPKEVRDQRKPIAELVASLDAHGHWALKEPRLCLLAPIFKGALVRPLAVIVMRHPLEIARSLRHRNGFPARAGLALWEAYMTAALRHGLAMDHVFADYDALVRDPEAALGRLAADLEALGVSGLDAAAGGNAISADLRRERVDDAEAKRLLTRPQLALWKALQEPGGPETAPGLSEEAIATLREFEADEGLRQRLEADARRLASERARLETERNALKAERDALLPRAKAGDEAAALKQRLSKADETLAQARAEARRHLDALRQKEGALEALRGRLAEQEAQLKAAVSESGRLAAERDAARTALAEHQKRREQAEAELQRAAGERDAQARRAEEAEARAEAAARAADAVRSTMSWRVTAPLRAVRRNPVSAWRARRRMNRLKAEIGDHFDAAWYASQYPDVAAGDRLPFHHFMEFGWREGRRPNPVFDPAWYLARNPDVAKAGINPLLHFARSGAAEGRDPSPEFSMRFYLERHADVAAAGLDPVTHYLRSGRREGREIRASGAVGGPAGADPEPGGAPAPARSAPTPPKPKPEPKPEPLPPAPVLAPERAAAMLQRIAAAPPVCVVIPVYNAPEETDRCLASVRRCTPETVRIVVLDDASPDARVAGVLKRHGADPRVEVRRNPENLGFTRNVNQGMSLAGEADVVLLNADTEVGPLWLQNLRMAAYSGDRVGTATPFSDNAGAFSAPEIGQANPLPPGVDAEAAARAVAQASLRLYPETPTGNGYCLYIRRDCLTETGLFDADAFPRGYGEENDFCMRARRRGWTHVVDDAGYVRHVRSASFGEEKAALLKQGRAVLDARHPDYTAAVRAFTGGETLRRAREQVRKALEKARNGPVRPRVLYVLPRLSPRGGTPQTNRDLMAAIDDQVEPWLLVSDGKTLELSRVEAGEPALEATAALPEALTPFPHRSAAYDAIVAAWLAEHRIELVHIRHIAKHSLGLIDQAKRLDLPVVFSFHDFYTVCPTVKLLDERNRHCAGRCTEGPGPCTPELWPADSMPPLKHAAVHDWRSAMGVALSLCDRFVTTAPSARALILDAFPDLAGHPFDVIPHGRDFPAFAEPPGAPAPDEPLRILVPGSVGYAKGAGLLAVLAEHREELNIELHVLGRISQGGPIAGVTEHGPYERDAFVTAAAALRPHVGAVLSVWPETYCHTLTELWAAGLPVIGSPLGAVAERITDSGAGWVPEAADPDALLNLVRHLRTHPEEIVDRQAAVVEARLHGSAARSCRQMGADYLALYGDFISLPDADEGPPADRRGFASYSGTLTPRPSSVAFNAAEPLPSCAVIIPVHNALEDVRRCIASVLAHTFPAVELILVDDGSQPPTAQFLRGVASAHAHVKLIRHDEAHGYTCAINAGARQAGADILIFLNSDTVVPPFWIERLAAPLLEDEEAAVCGPVSNAATWQSVPAVRKADGAWAVNTIPRPLSVAEYDRFVARAGRGLGLPRVPLVNGFCYAIRRSAFEAVGGLDEGAFPSGYGEETDLLLRLREAGYAAHINPSLYVFHAKSKSFGSERRKRLSAAGNAILRERWGRDRIEAAASALKDNAALITLRERISQRDPMTEARIRLDIAFLLPVSPGGGGVHSIAQEAGGLAARGHAVKILVRARDVADYERLYPNLYAAGMFDVFADEDGLVAAAGQHSVIVATHFLSVRLLKRARQAHPDRLFMYYVQDYEPWIVPDNSPLFAEAYGSYGELEGAVLVAKTRWLCRTVTKFHDVPVHKIAPSIEHAIYHDAGRRTRRPGDPIILSAMLRPSTPRRAPEATVDVLHRIRSALGEPISIISFGCDPDQLESIDRPLPPLDHRGVLSREGVADVLRQSDLFIDMSTYQAFGRTALEAMACGAVAACPERGGGEEYDLGGRAALRLPTHDVESSAERLISLLEDEDALSRMREAGLASARQFTIEKAALSIESVICRHLARMVN